MSRATPRVLTIDIETSPLLLAGWGLFDQNFGTNQILAPSRILCFAAKWLDEDEMIFSSSWDDGQLRMAQHLHELLDEAHIVNGYNSKRFDVKHVNREIMQVAKLPAPSPFQQIDVLTQWKGRFATPSNKLEYTSQIVGFESGLTKLQNEGMTLWLKCMGISFDPITYETVPLDPEVVAQARADMQEYNERDTQITEDALVFLRDHGWLVNTPNLAAFSDAELACKTCGEDDPKLLRKKASKPTQTGVWRFNYYCQSCNSHFTGSVDKNHQTDLKVVS